MFSVLIFMTCGVWCSEVIPVPHAWEHGFFDKKTTTFEVLDLPKGVRRIDVSCYGPQALQSDGVAVANERQTLFCNVFKYGSGFSGRLMNMAVFSKEAGVKLRDIRYGNVLVVSLSMDETLLEILEPKKGDRVQVVNINRTAPQNYGLDDITSRQGSTLFSVTEKELTVTKLLNPYDSENSVFFVKACFTYADLSKAVMQWGLRFLSGFEVVNGQCPLDLFV